MMKGAVKESESIDLKGPTTYPLCVLCAPGDTGCYFMTLTQASQSSIWSDAMMRMVASSITTSLEKQVDMGFEKRISKDRVDVNTVAESDLDSAEVEAVNETLYGLGRIKDQKAEETVEEARSMMKEGAKARRPNKLAQAKELKAIPKNAEIVKPSKSEVMVGGKVIRPENIARTIVAAMEDPKAGESYYVTPFSLVGWSDRMNNVIMNLKSLSVTLEERSTDEERKKRDAFMEANFDTKKFADWSGRYFFLVKSNEKREFCFLVMISYSAGMFAGEPVRENSLEVNGTLVPNVMPFSFGKIWQQFVNKVNPKTLKAGDWDALLSSYLSNGIMGMTVNQVWDSKTFQFVVVSTDPNH